MAGVASPGPNLINGTTSSWSPLGCLYDAVNGAPRTLANGLGGGATVTSCIDLAAKGGFRYAGLEYGGECWAGNSFTNTTNAKAPPADCNVPCTANVTQTCGAGNRLSAYFLVNYTLAQTSSFVAPAAAQLPTGWSVFGTGCVTDAVNGNPRTLSNGFGGGYTIETCATAASGGGYTFFGLEYGGECWADTTLRNTTNVDAPLTDCSMACTANTQEICGAGNRLSIYKSTAAVVTPTTTATTATAQPTTKTLPAGVTVLGTGCMTDAVNGAPRTFAQGLGGGSTIETCFAAATAGGYTLFGLEYGGECWADSSFRNNTNVDAPLSDCSMPCNSDATEKCGAGNRLSVYRIASTPAGTTSSTSSPASTTSPAANLLPAGVTVLGTGCMLDAVNGAPRTFSHGLGAGFSIASCYTAAASAGYLLFGVEYGSECWADTAFRNITNVDAPLSDCSFPCTADPTAKCGAGSRLSVFQAAAPITVQPTPTSTATGGSTTPTNIPQPNNIPTTWAAVGCYTEGTNGRALVGTAIAAPAGGMTNSYCITQCEAAGYTLAGTEYANECYCANDVRNSAAFASDQTSCNMACAGDATSKCGGPGRLSLFGKKDANGVANVKVWSPPAIVTDPNKLNGYKYLGCYNDVLVDAQGADHRALSWQWIAAGTLTVGTCLQHCRQFGYDFAGVEYGRECYCDTSIYPLAAVQPSTDCGIPCEGDPSQICGGVARLNVYQTNVQITNFARPTNTGRYEYLMGGVSVPLLSALTTKNKIVFLDKIAGGEPNGTHAYEYDYQITDYRLAFREMHVSTDIFCAAGIMLPDSAGRIMTVGGWADISLQGVRLYTPTGSTGINGTTDWEENYNTLHLQLQRWYPSILPLVNGSFAIFGGEIGSNSKNQPNVEVLPYTGAAPVDLPILQRTDPNNLYPFVFTLPSGSLFIAAYNEAELLDPITFATVKTLPTIPGAATADDGNPNGKGGRTYPMQGSATLLPFSPPYTDPAVVLICGGSIGAGGTATDNCVTTSPDAANPTWTIELMPFKRLMPNLVYLPDGTILILNGCQFGTAGFGLGLDPTLTAVLYDPSKPVNNRMSILGSTILARMYHSEAILTHDGRVVVSGSDPQQAQYPEQHIIEQYLPPYLTSGAPRPTFTIDTLPAEWAYGQTYTITATIPSGGVVRASLISPGVNTHGNSMGMRFAWLTITKVGNKYQVTMPPGQHILPANHYLLFVLDGPTPSVGQWIRLGGDPGNIGAWPNVQGFTLP
ncbi:glyoxal oxidase N-terminus-domain-containing protein [Zopfochytrium polystomum]|nr:glyoxal oxidase N-terminus-domain-containing protein [Zopfochytrium polystomum]